MRTILSVLIAIALVGIATPTNAHEFEVAGFYVTPNPSHATEGPVLWAEEAQVWEESNGVPGLQTCAYLDENRVERPADTQHSGPAPACPAL